MQLVELINQYCMEKVDLTTKSGHRIDFYVNLRNLTVSPLIQEISRLILEELPSEYDALGCSNNASCDLLIGCLASGPETLRGGAIGRDNKIKGTVKPDDRVIILEGISTSNYSVARCINIFTKFGCRVVAVIALVELNPSERLYCHDVGIRYQSLVKRHQLRLP